MLKIVQSKRNSLRGLSLVLKSVFIYYILNSKVCAANLFLQHFVTAPAKITMSFTLVYFESKLFLMNSLENARIVKIDTTFSVFDKQAQ